MNRFDIINRIGDKYRVGNTETGEFSYAQALKTVGKDIKDYQKATTGTQHKFLDIRFENERLVVLVECKNKFSRWDKAKIQGQLQDYVRFEKAYSDKKIVAILAETDGDEVWVWFGQSVIIDDEHRMEEETVLRTFEEYENLCFGRVNDKIKVVDSIKTLNEKLHSDGINEKLRSQFVGTCLLALKNGLVYKNVKETLDPKTGKKLAPERVVLKSIKDILEGLLTRGGSLNKAGKLAVLNSKVLDDQDVTSLTYKELEDILQFIDDNVVPYINDKSTAGQDLLNLFFNWHWNRIPRDQCSRIRILPVSSYGALPIDDFLKNNLLGSVPNIVHPLHPSHLIQCFQLFGNTLLCRHLLYKVVEHFSCPVVHLRKVTVQLTTEYQTGVQYRSMLFEVAQMPSAPHSDRRVIGFIQHETGDVIVTLKLIPKAVVLIVDVFFHDMCPPYVNLILR